MVTDAQQKNTGGGAEAPSGAARGDHTAAKSAKGANTTAVAAADHTAAKSTKGANTTAEAAAGTSCLHFRAGLSWAGQERWILNLIK